MELWTEYEGTTIDGAFPLTKLLRPEGRSALFSTSNGSGVAKVIRLIESHFDDDEILARWRGVAALNHPHLLKLEEYGKVTLDETALVYAVMEPVDTDLGEVLKGQRLTVPETRQLTVSLAAALETLHAHGFIHGHVEPASVLAVGEVVKLRSDCIREAPEGDEGRALKRQDLRDLAVVVLQALTQQRTLEAAARSGPLPAPFDQIVPKTMSGEWGAAEIIASLEPAAPPSPQGTVNFAPPAKPEAARPDSLPPAAAPREWKAPGGSSAAERIHIPVEREIGSGSGARAGVVAAVGVALILCIWLGWHFLHRPAAPASAPQAASTPAPVAADSSAPSAASTPSSDSGVPAASGRTAPTSVASPRSHGGEQRDQWRVITYTYNHEEQAQQKASTVAQRHPELHPEVFTPSGHAPYLVTVGGIMSRDEAFALVKKLRGQGLPGDSYAQNYSGQKP